MWLLRVVLLLGLTVGTTSHAAAPKAPRKLPNMPYGWAWPPTATMKAAGAKCLTDLGAAGVGFEMAPPTLKVATPIVVPDLRLGQITLQSIFRKPPFVMDCHLARAVAEHAEVWRMLGVAALRFSTIHRYRTIKKNGRKTNILSRHAIGLAMDVYEVELVDGSVLVVKHDYPHPTLLALEQAIASTDDFRTPLTPGNDPKGHDDHFHLEAKMPLTR